MLHTDTNSMFHSDTASRCWVSGTLGRTACLPQPKCSARSTGPSSHGRAHISELTRAHSAHSSHHIPATATLLPSFTNFSIAQLGTLGTRKLGVV